MYNELIGALRVCADCTDLQYGTGRERCTVGLMRSAADALEAAEKRIAKLEDELLPKSGKWIQMNGHRYCSRCGHKDSPILTNYCPNCGVRMRTVTDCHTFEEGER